VTSASFFDCPEIDQRGETRPAGNACDIGAFELTPNLTMRGVVHVQNLGDQPLGDSHWAGTKGQSLRLEGFALDFAPTVPGIGLEYMCHLQNIGDTALMPGESFCGTRGQSRRLEGFAIQLTGPEAATSIMGVIFKTSATRAPSRTENSAEPADSRAGLRR